MTHGPVRPACIRLIKGESLLGHTRVSGKLIDQSRLAVLLMLPLLLVVVLRTVNQADIMNTLLSYNDGASDSQSSNNNACYTVARCGLRDFGPRAPTCAHVHTAVINNSIIIIIRHQAPSSLAAVVAVAMMQMWPRLAAERSLLNQSHG